jgi:hypothetical protein
MTRIMTLFLTILLFTFAVCQADSSTIVGKWDCVGVDDAGQSSNWSLVVKEDGGKLTGTLSGDPGEFDIVDAKLDGDAFTFKVVVNDSTYTVESKLSGKKLDGKYKGPEGGGTIKGTKAS